METKHWVMTIVGLTVGVILILNALEILRQKTGNDPSTALARMVLGSGSTSTASP